MCRYLTDRVKGLTIGWHLFRTVTEGAFLAVRHGLCKPRDHVARCRPAKTDGPCGSL